MLDLGVSSTHKDIFSESKEIKKGIKYTNSLAGTKSFVLGSFRQLAMSLVLINIVMRV